MFENKSKINYSMPTSKAKKIWNENTAIRRNKNIFQIHRNKGAYKTGSQEYSFTRSDLLTLMEKGNFKASDISEIINKPLKTVKRWSNKNLCKENIIPLDMEDYKKIYFTIDKIITGVPVNII